MAGVGGRVAGGAARRVVVAGQLGAIERIANVEDGVELRVWRAGVERRGTARAWRPGVDRLGGVRRRRHRARSTVTARSRDQATHNAPARWDGGLREEQEGGEHAQGMLFRRLGSATNGPAIARAKAKRPGYRRVAGRRRRQRRSEGRSARKRARRNADSSERSHYALHCNRTASSSEN